MKLIASSPVDVAQASLMTLMFLSGLPILVAVNTATTSDTVEVYMGISLLMGHTQVTLTLTNKVDGLSSHDIICISLKNIEIILKDNVSLRKHFIVNNDGFCNSVLL